LIHITEVDLDALKEGVSARPDAGAFVDHPDFFGFSHRTLRANKDLLSQAGLPLLSSEIRVLQVTFEDGQVAFLPLISVRTEVGDADLVAAPTFAAALIPRLAAEGAKPHWMDLKLHRMLPNALFWTDDFGWNLDSSLMSTFARFSEEERNLMVRSGTQLDLEHGDLDADWAEFQSYVEESVSNKKRDGVPIIQRDHNDLRETYPDQCHLTFVRAKSKRIGAALWVRKGPQAALAEWVGNAEFRREKNHTLALFRFLQDLKTRDVKCLRATLFEWYLSPVWEALLEKRSHLPKEAERLLGGMPRLLGRGVHALVPE
jgi:hypothetical protein